MWDSLRTGSVLTMRAAFPRHSSAPQTVLRLLRMCSLSRFFFLRCWSIGGTGCYNLQRDWAETPNGHKLVLNASRIRVFPHDPVLKYHHSHLQAQLRIRMRSQETWCVCSETFLCPDLVSRHLFLYFNAFFLLWTTLFCSCSLARVLQSERMSFTLWRACAKVANIPPIGNFVQVSYTLTISI